MGRIGSERVKLKAKRTFLRKGTCSRTFFYLLDREFGHPMDAEEKAIDPLAGGILQQGYQCGMLWGASMAIGTEASRRIEDPGRSTALAILAMPATPFAEKLQWEEVLEHRLARLLRKTGKSD